MFKNATGQVLYVGKAKKLRQRVKSYFQPPVRLGIKTALLVSQIAKIDHIEVQSEIEALLLESRLIKKWLPPYNIASRDDKSPYYIHLTREKFPKPQISHQSQNALAGPFLSGFAARNILRQLRRVAPYCTAKRKVGRPCLYSHLGLCNPCPNDPQTTSQQYRKNISQLKSLLKGHFSQVKSQLKSEMTQASTNQNYEVAATVRDQLQRLQLLLEQPVLPDEYLINPNLVEDTRQQALVSLREIVKVPALHRIEMYDVANIMGKAATSAMTVAVNGEVNSRNFRHFTIKSKHTPDDVAMMQETLARRLKRTDWPLPDLIVLDGGKSQLSIIKSLKFPCPVIALAKKEEALIIPQDNTFKVIKLERTNPGLKLLQHLRDEAHRFSRRLHHKHRKVT